MLKPKPLQVFRQITDHAARLDRLPPRVMAMDEDAPFIERRQTENGLEQRRFARAVGAKQPENLAVDRQRNAVDSHRFVIALDGVFDNERRRFGRILGQSSAPSASECPSARS